MTVSWLDEIEGAFGVAADAGFGPPTLDVEAARWRAAATTARDGLDCYFFDYLTAVDELDEGFSVVLHVARRRPGQVESVLLRTRLARDAPTVDCVCEVYAGAGWHERETHEMFGIEFAGHGELATLLLPDEFEGHPLRKDFVLASRVAKPWPGAKEPGESDEGAAPSRRRTRPPGVPDPAEWPRAAPTVSSTSPAVSPEPAADASEEAGR
jgi:NADH-quinone oxidoreductase subunit C